MGITLSDLLSFAAEQTIPKFSGLKITTVLFAHDSMG